MQNSKIEKSPFVWLDKLSPRLAAAIFFTKFRKAKRCPLRDMEKPVMNAAKSEIVKIHGNDTIIYSWGAGGKPVLFAHGWESRASRFYLFIQALQKRGYQPIAFDAPGHGASEGITTNLKHYHEIMTILQNRFGVFEAIVSHSLGSLNTFYAMRKGIITKKMIAFSSICDFGYLTYRFSSFYQLKPETIKYLNKRVEALFPEKGDVWEKFSSIHEPEKIKSEVLLIHDRDDLFVEFAQSRKIDKALGQKSRLCITSGLGHFQILNDSNTVEQAVNSIAAGKIKNSLFDRALAPDMI